MGGFPKNCGVKIGHRYPLVFILALRYKSFTFGQLSLVAFAFFDLSVLL
jgi:hypothetical protein